MLYHVVFITIVIPAGEEVSEWARATRREEDGVAEAGGDAFEHARDRRAMHVREAAHVALVAAGRLVDQHAERALVDGIAATSGAAKDVARRRACSRFGGVF